MSSHLRCASVVCLIAAFASAAGEHPPADLGPGSPSAAATRPKPRTPVGWIRLVEEKHPAATALVEKELDKVLPKLHFPGIGFGDVIQFFRDVSNLSMHPRWEALRAANIDEKTPVNVNLRNVSLRAAMQIVLDDVGGRHRLGWGVREGVVMVSTQADLSRFVTTRIYDVSDLLGARPTPADRAAARRRIREALHKPLATTRPAGKEGQTPTLADLAAGRIDELAEAVGQSVHSRRVERLMTLIRATLGPACPICGGADDWSIHEFDGKLVVRIPPAEHDRLGKLLAALRGADRPPRPAPTTMPARAGRHDPDAMVEAALDRRVPKARFNGVHFGDAMAWIRDVGGLGFAIKYEALREAGVDERTPVNVTLTNTSLRRVLWTVLADVGGVQPITYAVSGGRIVITTQKDLESQLETRVYDLGRLLRPHRGSAAETIRLRALLAETYGREDATAEVAERILRDGRMRKLAELVGSALRARNTGSPRPPAGAVYVFDDKLIVRGSAPAHRDVARLLKALVGYEPPGAAAVKPLPPLEVELLPPPPTPPPPFEFPPIVAADRWPAGKQTALAEPLELLGVKTSRMYVVFLVDASGSMLDTLDIVKHHLEKAVAKLSAKQHFAVIFHSAGRVRDAFGGRLLRATKDNKLAAVKMMRAIHAQGRTDSVAALQEACRAMADANGSGSQVVFFASDGEFADNQKTLAMARNMAKKLKVVIHAVPYPPHAETARRVMKKIAQATGGECTLVGWSR